MQDRRLDQDDNRGMGQPVHDNIPLTKSTFRLLLESNRQSDHSTLHNIQSQPVLTLLSHLSLQSLLNPLIIMTDSSPLEAGPQMAPDFPGLQHDLPCDVHLLNLRTNVARESDDGVAASQFPSATALMLLHRVGVDCRRGISASKCRALSLRFPLKSAFKPVLSLPLVEEAGPSPLMQGQLVPVNGEVALDAMHIRAFRFPLT